MTHLDVLYGDHRMPVFDRRRFVFNGIAGTLTCLVGPAAADDFTLTIARKYRDQKCTSGYLAVNGKIIAYTLELPWRGNAPLISSIPDGRYSGLLRYDHPDKWRIELKGVPGRQAVQIHTGNSPDDSEGCILIGLKLGGDLCSVIDSKKAYDDLRIAFYGSSSPSSTPNKTIVVVAES